MSIISQESTFYFDLASKLSTGTLAVSGSHLRQLSSILAEPYNWSLVFFDFREKDLGSSLVRAASV